MNEQIHRDLCHRINLRLYQWAADSADLYEMADLSEDDAYADIMTAVTSFLVFGIIKLKINEQDFLLRILKEVEQQRARIKKEQQP